ncbi:MAG: HPr family phosphocarrier protein [Planctomycetota bacterium]
MAQHDVAIPNTEGLHARPVMRFVALAAKFHSQIWVTNLTRNAERLDGKSAMQLMLLEATQGCVLRIEAQGADSQAAVTALADLIASGFDES